MMIQQDRHYDKLNAQLGDFYFYFQFQILSYEPTDTVEGVRCQTTKEFKEQLIKLIAAHRSELDKE